MMKTRGIGFVLFVFISFFCIAPAFGSCEESEIIAAAEEFVTLIDSGLYGESWDAGDGLLQIRTVRDEWIRNLTLQRDIFGWAIDRHLKLTAYRHTLPGLPDGDYMIVMFESVFDNKKAAVETVVMVLNEYGEWRSAGYSLK